MNHRVLTAAIALTTFLLPPLFVAAQPRVDVRVEWLPDPGASADWELATAEAIQAAELAEGRLGEVPPEVTALYELLNQAGQNAVASVVAEVDPDAPPVAVSRMVADEIPLEIDALCTESDAFNRPCVALEQWGVTAIGVKAPPTIDDATEGFIVRFGLRPGVLLCLQECGLGPKG